MIMMTMMVVIVAMATVHTGSQLSTVQKPTKTVKIKLLN